ncbi:MAG TPA: PspC domain-containing protein [Woeseiaceae bacterium]|nr:PspC domain-containing protein [Woeseiaceae bacterium]
MSTNSRGDDRRFVRSSDDAMLGGVCAGLADYFGFNRKATRLLAVVGFFINPLLATVAYIATVMLVPARATATQGGNHDPAFKKTLRSAPANAMGDMRRRFQSLDRRLARLERYVTSSRYQLDREFRDLEQQ